MFLILNKTFFFTNKKEQKWILFSIIITQVYLINFSENIIVSPFLNIYLFLLSKTNILHTVSCNNIS